MAEEVDMSGVEAKLTALQQTLAQILIELTNVNSTLDRNLD
tara:strand:+ start:923 stop:1045 length:123 start_codon:yes stop_codon:yes gene_type:complete